MADNKFQPTSGAFKVDGSASELVHGKIVAALGNKQYKARTITGIAKEIKVPQRVVVKAIREDKRLSGIVKVFPIRSKDGRILLTTKDRFAQEATPKEKFVDFFASKRLALDGVGVDDAE